MNMEVAKFNTLRIDIQYSRLDSFRVDLQQSNVNPQSHGLTQNHLQPRSIGFKRENRSNHAQCTLGWVDFRNSTSGARLESNQKHACTKYFYLGPKHDVRLFFISYYHTLYLYEGENKTKTNFGVLHNFTFRTEKIEAFVI